MPSPVPHVQARVLSEFRRVVRQRGGDPDALLERVGLKGADVADPDALIPLSGVLQLFEEAAAACKDPWFGLHYAEVFPVGGTGLLGQMIATAPTVRDMLAVIARYARIHIDNTIEFEERPGIGRLYWDFPVRAGARHTQYSLFSAGVVALRTKQFLGSSWRPPTISMVGPAPGDMAECIRVLGFPIKFGERRNQLAFDTATLAQRIPQPVQGLFDTLKSVGERELAEIERSSDIVASVRHALIATFGTDAAFDLEAIAQRLSLSARALQWRLGQHETTYERLLTEARRDVAERMLLETQAPMTEIAAHLRFSELSAFTRAAHRWFGMSPTEYRRRLRSSRAGDGGASAA